MRMITKDISLEDCLLDLVDNCLDGARRILLARGPEDMIVSYDGFYCHLTFSETACTVRDNCGGIGVENAKEYAFRFGRRFDTARGGHFSIGLYGIGMKRALLKMGRDIKIHSATDGDSFLCEIAVDKWLQRDEWEFEMNEDVPRDDVGTTIEIGNLYRGIAGEFADSTFSNGLARIVARDYVLFIEKGFRIVINGSSVKPRQYIAKTSEEFKPYRRTYEDHGVHVDILAGMAASPPNRDEPSRRTGTEYYGWYVFCNDRAVLAADKSERTVWDNEVLVRWHPQYNGFVGMVLFHARDPNRLPWTTTKRDIDESSPLYRRAVTEMKSATEPWVEYTGQRKADLREMRQKERATHPVPFFGIEENATFKVPRVPKGVRIANILYQRPRAEVIRAAKAFGRANLPYRTVGEKTFEYFMKHEVEGDE